MVVTRTFEFVGEDPPIPVARIFGTISAGDFVSGAIDWAMAAQSQNSRSLLVDWRQVLAVERRALNEWQTISELFDGLFDRVAVLVPDLLVNEYDEAVSALKKTEIRRFKDEESAVEWLQMRSV